MLQRLGVLASTSLGAALALAPIGSALAADEPPLDSITSIQHLSDQARYWEDHTRFDLARDTWLKVLLIDTDDRNALAHLVRDEAAQGHTAAAQGYLDHLKRSYPDSPEIAGAEAAIRAGAIDGAGLTAARAYARQGQYKTAIQAYDRLFGNNIPGGKLGLEYYQTLAGMPDGWAPARAGLEKLARENPDDPAYARAYAQHLTYRDTSRHEGIDKLQAMSRKNQDSLEVRDAWRQALLWLGEGRADEAYYQAYLDRYGQDKPITEKLASARADNPAVGRTGVRIPTRQELRGREIKDAFDLLNAGNLDTATTRFQAILAGSPGDTDALGGLGIIRLKQQRYTDARILLEQADRSAGTAHRYRDALGTAHFWELVREGEAARKAGALDVAEHQFREAMSFSPAKAAAEPTVTLALADILAEEARPLEAEKLYRGVLQREPANIDATRGLIGVLAGTNRIDMAIALADKLSPADRADIGGYGALKAQQLRSAAEKLIASGDTVAAEPLLREALLLDPDSPYTRLDLAQLYQSQQRDAEAESLIDGLLQADPAMPDALFGKALVLAQQKNWYEGLQTLERIPAESRTRAMAGVQKRLWIHYQADRANVLAHERRPGEAAAALAQLQAQAGDDPEFIGVLANAYADNGDTDRAVRVIRQSLGRSRTANPGLQIQYAGLLLKLKQDAELDVLLDKLSAQHSLTAQQNLDLANLCIAYRLRKTDEIRQQGDLAGAYEGLAPLLRLNPNDPRLQMALAQLYSDSKDEARALAIYQHVLELDPANLDAYKGAANSEMALKHFDAAEDYVTLAMKLEPADPHLYALAGHLARAEGHEGRALDLFQRALRLDAAHGGDNTFADGNFGPRLQVIEPGSAAAGAHQPIVLDAAHLSRLAYHPRAGLNADQAMAGWNVRSTPVGGLIDEVYHPAVVSSGRMYRVAMQAEPASSDTGGTTIEGSSGYWRQNPDGTYVYIPKAHAPPTTPAQQIPRESSAVAAPPAMNGTGYGATVTSPRPSTRANRPAAATLASDGGPPPSAGLVLRMSLKLCSLQSCKPAAGPTDPRVAQAVPAHPAPLLPAPAEVPIQTQMPRESDETAAPARRAPVTDERSEVARQISELQTGRSAYVEAGFDVRSRDGQNGLGRLTDLEVPVEGSIASVAAGRFTFRAIPVYLDSGPLSGTDVPKFGSLALVPDSQNLRFDENATGAAVDAAYKLGDFQVDIGSSPLGFPVENIVGGIRWTPSFDRFSLKLNLSRRSVTDSLLSYAGARDPGLGKDWGGITKSGGRIDIAYDLGRFGVYAVGAYSDLDGLNVAQNREAEGAAGIYARAIDRPGMQLTYGLNITSLFYDKNLSFFTYGHGGYFSPQQYYSFGVPVELDGGTRRFGYRVKALLGVQTFKEDGNTLYPNDSQLQAAILAVAAQDTTIATGYASKSSSGVGFNFSGAAEYLLDRNVSVGGRFGVDNARDYSEVSGLAYVRFWFTPQSNVSIPPMPLAPNYSYGDPDQ